MSHSESEQAAALRDYTERITENFDVDIDLTLVLPNKVDSRTALAAEYLGAFEDEYPDEIAPEPIPQSQDIRNAADNGMTAFGLEEPSTAAQRARERYEAAARAFLERARGDP